MRLIPLSLLTAVLLGFMATPSHAQNFRFGGDIVFSDGEVLIAESSNNLRPGQVYIYRKSGQAWQETGLLTAPDAEARDGFGSSLTLSGSTLFVGQRGMLHVFDRSASGSWTASGSVAVADVEPAQQFGAAVAASGEWLLVGAPARAGGRGAAAGERSGVVYVFRRSGDAWQEQGTINAPDAAPGDHFGTAIAISGDRALIGAPGMYERAGSAHVYRLDGQGAWRHAQEIQGEGIQANEGFGSSVALDSELAVIGAPMQGGGAGASFLFRHDAATATWVGHTRLSAFAGGALDRFGTSVALSGSDVWVGAPSVGLNQGSTYHFTGEGQGEGLTFASASRMGSDESERSDRFGQRVVPAESTVAVAATGRDFGAGSVFMYSRGADGDWHADGMLASEHEGLETLTGSEIDCEAAGKIGDFDCGNVALLAYVPVSMLTMPGEGRGSRLNDIWGWTDPETDREYAVVGRIDGTSFVDVTDPMNPMLIGDLPTTPDGPLASTWRDIKVYSNHAYIVADAAGAHGMQVFDMAQLRDFDGEPVTFEPTAHYTEINSAHNVVINEESGFAYVVGASGGGETCGGGLHMVDIREPASPTFAGCFQDPQTGRRGTGYSHDAQCVMYRGPDERYSGREICLGSNETAISIADVTDKANPVALSRASYPNVAYTHQGWLSEDHRYFYVNDELDELSGVERTRTLVWDLQDLEDPRLANEFMGTSGASDHNLYILGDLMYQSNYRAGLRIIDISDREAPREVGYMDTSPFLASEAGFSGTWSNFPYFRSGAIAVTSVNEGLFLVRYKPTQPVF